MIKILITRQLVKELDLSYRMGRIAGLYSPTTLARVQGMRTNSAGIPTPFVTFAEQPGYTELWHDGVYILHNPNAAP